MSSGKAPGWALSWWLLSAAAMAAPPDEPPVEEGLRRKVTLQGQESQRFKLADRMRHYQVPGFSMAIVDNCKIVDARGFGNVSAGGVPVTPRTLFQAASVSKPVAAAGALRLVETGKLALDADVQGRLGGWTLPESPQQKGQPVTLRRLLSHSAGLSVHGFQGYRIGTPVPAITDILDGKAPANSAPVRIALTPATEWRYSGGGYVLAQLLMTEAAGKSFPQLMDDLVLKPSGMADSSFAQPLDEHRAKLAAVGTAGDGKPVPGGWHVYPEMAAAGLWTTPSDLAKFAVALVRAQRGEPDSLLRQATAEDMLRQQFGNWGLGPQVGGAKGPRRFVHNGANEGFRALWIMYPDTCQGAALMANADEGMPLIEEVVQAIAHRYQWPELPPRTVRTAVPLAPEIAERFVGNYRLRDFPDQQFSVTKKSDGTLYFARQGRIGRDLLPESPTRLFSPDSGMTLEVEEGAPARAQVLHLVFGSGKNVAERIAPATP